VSELREAAGQLSRPHAVAFARELALRQSDGLVRRFARAAEASGCVLPEAAEALTKAVDAAEARLGRPARLDDAADVAAVGAHLRQSAAAAGLAAEVAALDRKGGIGAAYAAEQEASLRARLAEMEGERASLVEGFARALAD